MWVPPQTVVNRTHFALVGTPVSSASTRTTSSFDPPDGAPDPGSRWQAASDANTTRKTAPRCFTMPNIDASRSEWADRIPGGRAGQTVDTELTIELPPVSAV